MRGVFDQYRAAAHGLARGQLHLGLIGRQAIELVDGLLDFSQVQYLAAFAGKGHGQLAVRQLAVVGALQAFEFALHHQHLQMPLGHVLLRQVGATRHQALVDVEVGEVFEQGVEL